MHILNDYYSFLKRLVGHGFLARCHYMCPDMKNIDKHETLNFSKFDPNPLLFSKYTSDKLE